MTSNKKLEITKEEFNKLFLGYVDTEKYFERFISCPADITNMILEEVGTGNDYFIKSSSKDRLAELITIWATENAEGYFTKENITLQTFGKTRVKQIKAINQIKKVIKYFTEKEADLTKPVTFATNDKELQQIIFDVEAADLPTIYGNNKTAKENMQKYLFARRTFMTTLRNVHFTKLISVAVPGVIPGLYVLNNNIIENIDTLFESTQNVELPKFEGEEWRDIAGLEGSYKISNFGRVLSMNYKQSGMPGLLKPSHDHYLEDILKVSLKGKSHSIRRLVYEAFIGPTSATCLITHIDGDYTNCRVENLAYRDDEDTAEFQEYKNSKGEKMKAYWTVRKKS